MTSSTTAAAAARAGGMAPDSRAMVVRCCLIRQWHVSPQRAARHAEALTRKSLLRLSPGCAVRPAPVAASKSEGGAR